MNYKHNYTKITLTGMNLERFINILRDNDIDLYNIHRESYNSMSMYVWDQDVKYIKDNAGNIDIYLQEHYGISQWLKFCYKRIGLVVGVVFSIITILILNAYTLHINIIGIETIDREQVITALNCYGIKIGHINNYNVDDLNKYLLNNIEGISLVSTEKIGTSLIINIKEKSVQLEEGVDNYISPYNMIIKDFEIFSGIGNINKDQIVRKGDVLIYAQEYLDSDGVLHLVVPRAKLNVTIWHTKTTTILKEETKYVRTGKKNISYKYMLGKNTIVNKEIQNNYKYFENEESTINLSNLLPIVIHKNICYETRPEVVKNDFQKLRDKIIANLKTLVYNEVSDDEIVVDDIVDIIELEDRYIVNYYLECNKDIYIGEELYED